MSLASSLRWGLVAASIVGAWLVPHVIRADDDARTESKAAERKSTDAKRRESETERKAAVKRLEADAERMAAEAERHADRARMIGTSIHVLRGGRLGVRLAEVDSEAVTRLHLPEERGALVRQVEPDSPAAKAGIKVDDVIVRYQGQPVEGTNALVRMVLETPVGRTAAIEVKRAGAAVKLSAQLSSGEAEGGMSHFEMPLPPMPHALPKPFRWGDRDEEDRLLLFRPLGERPGRLGVRCQDVEGQLAEHFGLSAGRGVLVVHVAEGSPAAKAGVKAGDVIVRLDGESIEDVGDLQEEVSGAEAGHKLTLRILRGGKPLDLGVTLPGDESRDEGRTPL